MGWDGCDDWKKKSDVVKSRLNDYAVDSTFEVLASKSTKSGLWIVVRNRQTGLKGIFFDLIQKERGHWYVKSMDESMGPYYYDCPAKFLDLVPPRASEAFMFNLDWRSRVQANRRTTSNQGACK